MGFEDNSKDRLDASRAETADYNRRQEKKRQEDEAIKTANDRKTAEQEKIDAQTQAAYKEAEKERLSPNPFAHQTTVLGANAEDSQSKSAQSGAGDRTPVSGDIPPLVGYSALITLFAVIFIAQKFGVSTAMSIAYGAGVFCAIGGLLATAGPLVASLAIFGGWFVFVTYFWPF